MSTIRWSPSRTLFNLKDEVDRLVDEFLGAETESVEGRITPPVNIEETSNEFILTAELPGVNKNDVKITFQDGTLNISGHKKAEKEFKEGNFHRYERRYGMFSRTFSLPNTIDVGRIEATFQNGVLTIRLPKKEEAKPKQIEVKVQ